MAEATWTVLFSSVARKSTVPTWVGPFRTRLMTKLVRHQFTSLGFRPQGTVGAICP